MPAPIVGLHHVTAVASDPQRNLDFYTQVLGLRFVKRTVNFDDPGILNDMNLVPVIHCLDCCEGDAGLSPESLHNDLLLPSLFNRGNKILVVPGIHAGTFNGGLIRKDRLHLWPKNSAEALRLNRCEHVRHAEYSGCFGKHDVVVDDRLTVQVRHPKQHLRLQINLSNHAVVRC